MIFYIEEEVKNHFRTQSILEKFPKKTIIYIERYGEIFNRKNQNFLLQKQNPSFIIAKKYGSFVHRLKEKSGIGSSNNYYFSPLLNCPYDCKYCFLQGLYRSAFFLLFVNFEDFQNEIDTIINTNPNSYFFAGYDADSLALDHITEITKNFIPLFKDKNSFLELRTKCTDIEGLLESPILQNVIIAYSLNPQILIEKLEKKTSSLKKRIEAILRLQRKGFSVGLRLDPLIYHVGFEENYLSLLNELLPIFKKDVHSVTLGTLRYPKECFANMQRCNPGNFLLAPLLENNLNNFSYDEQKRNELLSFCFNEISKYVPKEKIFTYEECS